MNLRKYFHITLQFKFNLLFTSLINSKNRIRIMKTKSIINFLNVFKKFYLLSKMTTNPQKRRLCFTKISGSTCSNEAPFKRDLKPLSNLYMSTKNSSKFTWANLKIKMKRKKKIIQKIWKKKKKTWRKSGWVPQEKILGRSLSQCLK